MNMTFSITLGEILFAIAFVVGVLLIFVLIKAFSILSKVDRMVSYNRENINELLTVLPQTLTSVNETVLSVKHTVDSAGNAIDFIGDNVAPKAAGALSGAEGVIDVIKIVSEVVRAAIHHFGNKE